MKRPDPQSPAHATLDAISLLAITPGDGRDLLPWLSALAEAGLPAVLIREPTLPLADLRQLSSLPIPAIVVHTKTPHAADLGLPLHGPGRLGRSCHRAREVDAAFRDGAHYALLSPVWHPTSKPDDVRPTLGLDPFLRCARDRPVFALGGVTAVRYRSLRTHGARAAVSGALFGTASPRHAAEALRGFLRET
jgi:hypothetical protein